ncbi:hypothetical protein [Alysiella filiformis]|uniref:hypothetical protein n=1 Tax=Alysiella filiformis TaxID=194196 RepID=UPI0011784DBC|nr:hypothetical protein [Alysiella filiformis]QMT31462.1 hypothetical protein H3L97_00665 [Alysiella filiformis]UBQ55526.1 hypothetical protein JF568_08010 [Alysiella filiformis DSM 16848]
MVTPFRLPEKVKGHYAETQCPWYSTVLMLAIMAVCGEIVNFRLPENARLHQYTKQNHHEKQ